MRTIKLKIRKPTKRELQRAYPKSQEQYYQEFSNCINWYREKLEKDKILTRRKIRKLCYQAARRLLSLSPRCISRDTPQKGRKVPTRRHTQADIQRSRLFMDLFKI